MSTSLIRLGLVSLCLFGCLDAVENPQAVPDLTSVADDGTITIQAPAVPESFRNPRTDAYEAAFRERYNALLDAWTRNEDGSYQKVDNRRYFESEKWSYPNAMMHVIAGNIDNGMAILQANDQPQNPQDNQYTLGIDLYPAFTLKGQTRKFFQFGHLMAADYRAKMARAIDIWSEEHPRHTPHPAYGTYDPKAQGWGPNRFGNRRLDGRRTDNLYAMSTIATYLFAEAAGNEDTRRRAKGEILGYVWALYHIGHGEWDSTTYHPHVMAPYLTLYDFAQDPEVRMAAKLACDHFMTSIALKSHRLTFAGPSKRDYGHTSTQGGEAMKFFWLYFGGPEGSMGKEHDQAHAMMSAYRPPPAVLALANRDLALPVEILSTKPEYENWQDGASDHPRNFETLFLAETYTAGSVVAAGGDGDLLPFRIVFDRGATGTNTLTVNSQPKINAKHGGDQVGHYRDAMVWLRATQDKPFRFLLAEGGDWQQRGERWFLDGGDTWFALATINLGPLTRTDLDGKQAKNLPSASDWYAEPGDGPVTGFALEIGERGEHDSFDAFVAAIESAPGLVIDAGNPDHVTYTATDGRVLDMVRNPDTSLPVVRRDGELRDWDDPSEWALWRTVGQGQPVVDLGWKDGDLTVRAGGHVFEGHFELEGHSGSEVRRQDLERIQSELSTSDDTGFSNH